MLEIWPMMVIALYFITTHECSVVLCSVASACLSASTCNAETFDWKLQPRKLILGRRVHLENFQVRFVYQDRRIQVKVNRSKKREISSLHPLLWQTWRSLAATAVMTSPFQSFRVGRYLLAGTQRRHVQTANFQSADKPCNDSLSV